jgi:acyl transferase domain-containing protein
MNEQLPVPIAIIGMSCRFPGGANDPDKLWEMVSNGRTSWTDVPEDRWRWKSFYNPHPEANGAHNARGGCFLDSDISEFDAGFFGIPPAEATAMDPQHRFQIESAFEALESAGIPVETLKGTDTAVFTAIASRDYDRMAYKETSDIAKYHLTGCGDPTLCGRISYLFDLKGPSVTLDTGCSGSLVCLHQACTSLRTGESNMAIVGGTHLLLGPDLTIAMSLLQ